MNRIKDKLQRGEPVLVFNPDFPSPALVEHAGGLGFDAAFIDCEHGSASFERVEEMARAARAAGMTSILRPLSSDAALITRYLDRGVGGVQVPHVEDAASARSLIEIVRTARGAQFADTLIVAMIETPTAVDHLPDIVNVEGLDAVVVGMADLARSLGHSGDSRHPEVRRTVDAIIRTVCAQGKTIGINLHHWEDGPALLEKGVRWFTVHARTMLSRGTREMHAILTPDRTK